MASTLDFPPVRQSGAQLLHQRRRLEPGLRRSVTETRAWALHHGRPVDADALTVVLLAVEAEWLSTGVWPTYWTTDRIQEFLWTTAWAWCLDHDIDLPAHLGDALDAWLCFLVASGHVETDPGDLGRLRLEIQECDELETDARGYLAELTPTPAC